jgi:peptidoglycan/xylan/chitin deacetylase (PgdA/CDA1 family)
MFASLVQFIFLSHDVDWRKQGPRIEHVMARRNRFDKDVLEHASVKNPYYNIPEMMALEERLGLRSTFFFRTLYENGNLYDYEDDIKSLIAGGWEIGLHTDSDSITDLGKIKQEKMKLESLARHTVNGNRVHDLYVDLRLFNHLQKLGFTYDSSVKRFKDKISCDDMNFYFTSKGLIEFPLTLMDAYLFTYMKINETQIVNTFSYTLDQGRRVNSEFNVISVLWHDCSLKMVGGRCYSNVLEYLASQEDVEIVKGADLALQIKKKRWLTV